MAFDFEKIAHVGGASSAPRVYAYETSDERTVVLGTGYFDSYFMVFQVKDIIIVNNTDDIYSCRVIAKSTNSVTVEKTSLSSKEYAHYYVPSQTDVLLSDGATYYPVTGMALGLSDQFQLVGGELVYTGVGGDFLFNGNIDCSSSKVMDLTVAMELNDVITSQAIVRSFTSANKRGSASSTGLLSLSTGDTISVQLNSNGTNGVTISIFGMNLTFVEL